MRRRYLFSAIVCGILLCVGAVFGGMRLHSTSAPAEEGVFLPIFMYHSILKNPSAAGAYVISPDALEADLRFLSEHGYEAITVRDLIDFCEEKKPLPKRCVMLTFDDGYLNNLTYALPLLEKYRMRAVISIVGEYTDLYSEIPDDHVSYAHLSWEECRRMRSGGLVEFQNHSDRLHHLEGRKGSNQKRGEETAAYQRMLIDDLAGMQKKMTEELGEAATAYTYPYGSVGTASLPVVRMLGFSASFSCTEGLNRLTGDREELYLLKRFLRSEKRSAEEILRGLGLC